MAELLAKMYTFSQEFSEQRRFPGINAGAIFINVFIIIQEKDMWSEILEFMNGTGLFKAGKHHRVNKRIQKDLKKITV